MFNNQIILQENHTLNSDLIEQAQDWESYLSLGQELRLHKDTSQWLLGLLALKVQKQYGEDSLGKFAKEIGVQVNSLEVYRWTVNKYLENDPNFAPVTKLPFSLYQTVANLPATEREALLKQADEGDYSIERMRLEKDRVTHPERKQKPKFTTRYCEVHNKWIFQPKNPEEWELPHE